MPPELPSIRAISVADVNNDGVLDVLAVRADGVIVRLSDKNEGQGWDTAELARLNNAPNYLEGVFRLRVVDLDNNGGNDLVLTSLSPAPAGGKVAGALIWLSDEQNKFQVLNNALGPPVVFDCADANGDGRLDLVGLTADGQPVQAINHGTKNYHWQAIRPRAAQATGDQRINSFGIGGEMEIRAGLLVQKQLVTGPIVHFGLGRSNRRRCRAHRMAQWSGARRV